MKHQFFITLMTLIFSTATVAKEAEIKVATFNVSMEALNYSQHKQGEMFNAQQNTLSKALASDHQQIKNIAEIIQTTNPDIILLNEFDNQHDNNVALKVFIKNYLNVSQNGQAPIDFPYYYQGSVNTGINSGLDIDGNGEKGKLPGDGFGFGYFPGHFGMVLLSKYPIDIENIRTFQYFKWHDMPNALMPINPETKQAWYSQEVWENLRLSSKSHWDIPVDVNGEIVHILASHPTPPVFDGPEDRNGKKNHDEIRFWHDYITPNNANYIYDDNGRKGGLAAKQRFVILGDLNATTVDGNAIKAGIASLLTHKNIQDALPKSQGGSHHSPDNLFGKNHTAAWRMRVDYVLPSTTGFDIQDAGIFWPVDTDDNYRLIKDRKASSDHRLVWVALAIKE